MWCAIMFEDAKSSTKVSVFCHGHMPMSHEFFDSDFCEGMLSCRKNVLHAGFCSRLQF